MMSMPLFKDNPDYANFGDMAASGIIDGYEGPPTRMGLEGQQRQGGDAGHAEDPCRPACPPRMRWPGAPAEIEKMK